MTFNAKVENLIVIVILTFVLFGCSKDDEQIVPYVNVNLKVELSLPEFKDLLVPGNVYIKKGFGYNQNGIVIYRNSLEEFSAFDATCPKHIETKTAVQYDGGLSSGQVKCPHCSTVYYLFNYAYPSEGYPLRRYKLTNTGNVLYINN